MCRVRLTRIPVRPIWDSSSHFSLPPGREQAQIRNRTVRHPPPLPGGGSGDTRPDGGRHRGRGPGEGRQGRRHRREGQGGKDEARAEDGHGHREAVEHIEDDGPRGGDTAIRRSCPLADVLPTHRGGAHEEVW